MSQSSNLGPLKIVAVGDTWHVSLPSSDELAPDLPPNLDRLLLSEFTEFFRRATSNRVTLDLNGVPAISSHQLGLMLALQKALREKIGKLPITGASDSVLKLLEMTNTAQFFDVSGQS